MTKDVVNLNYTESWVSQPDVCRCCMSASGTWDVTAAYITDTGQKEVYSEILQECFGISLSCLLQWGPSRMVCEMCVGHLRDANSFRKQVVEAEKQFAAYHVKTRPTFNPVVNEATRKSSKDLDSSSSTSKADNDDRTIDISPLTDSTEPKIATRMSRKRKRTFKPKKKKPPPKEEELDSDTPISVVSKMNRPSLSVKETPIKKDNVKNIEIKPKANKKGQSKKRKKTPSKAREERTRIEREIDLPRSMFAKRKARPSVSFEEVPTDFDDESLSSVEININKPKVTPKTEDIPWTRHNLGKKRKKTLKKKKNQREKEVDSEVPLSMVSNKSHGSMTAKDKLNNNDGEVICSAVNKPTVTQEPTDLNGNNKTPSKVKEKKQKEQEEIESDKSPCDASKKNHESMNDKEILNDNGQESVNTNDNKTKGKTIDALALELMGRKKIRSTSKEKKQTEEEEEIESDKSTCDVSKKNDVSMNVEEIQNDQEQDGAYSNKTKSKGKNIDALALELMGRKRTRSTQDKTQKENEEEMESDISACDVSEMIHAFMSGKEIDSDRESENVFGLDTKSNDKKATPTKDLNKKRLRKEAENGLDQEDSDSDTPMSLVSKIIHPTLNINEFCGVVGEPESLYSVDIRPKGQNIDIPTLINLNKKTQSLKDNEKEEDTDSDTPISVISKKNKAAMSVKEFINIEEQDNVDIDENSNKNVTEETRNPTEVNIKTTKKPKTKSMVSPKKLVIDTKTIQNKNITLLLKNATIIPFRRNINKFQCQYCDQLYFYFKDLRNHINLRHWNIPAAQIEGTIKIAKNLIRADVSEIYCKLCGKKIKTIEKIIAHLQKIHKKRYNKISGLNNSHGIIGYDLSDGNYKCYVCKKQFRFYRQLDSHINEHDSDYACRSCGKKIINYHCLNDHKNLQTTKKIKCEHSDLIFGTTVKNYFVRKQHSKGLYKCPKCPHVFQFLSHRTKHMADCHNLKKANYSCEICNKFYAPSSVKKVRFKKLNSDFLCEMCDKIKSQNFKTISGAKSFDCSFCKKKFNKKIRMYTHIVSTHLRIKQFFCPVCKDGFITKQALIYHFKLYHFDVKIDIKNIRRQFDKGVVAVKILKLKEKFKKTG